MNPLKEYLLLLSSIVLLTLFIAFLDSHMESVFSREVLSGDNCATVVIDAGHGGFDSGKVGVDGTLEKNVNLSVARKLERLLQAADVRVIMTRTEDISLSENVSTRKKREDMLNRTALMNSAAPDCIVSIHQNSYPDEAVKGAQVFYHTGSKNGKTLASLIQQQFILTVDPSNHRVEKGESSYYLLKNAHAPIVIAECGFLSNREESKKLVDDAYQQKLAWAIHLGILQYLNLPENAPE